MYLLTHTNKHAHTHIHGHRMFTNEYTTIQQSKRMKGFTNNIFYDSIHTDAINLVK